MFVTETVSCPTPLKPKSGLEWATLGYTLCFDEWLGQIWILVGGDGFSAEFLQ